MSSKSSAVLSGIGSLAVLAIFTLIWVASCWTRMGPERGQDGELEILMVEVDPENPRHRRISEALAHAWMATGQPVEQLDLVIAQSSDLNAASFGSGAFVFWIGVADLPQWAIDAIAAHEVAHDVLLHSRRASDLAALMNFFAEVLGLLGGTDYRTEATLRDWLQAATLPSYTRAQELEADQKAIELLTRLGYDNPAQVFAGTLQILQDRYGDTGGGFFESHPATSERISEAIQR